MHSSGGQRAESANSGHAIERAVTTPSRRMRLPKPIVQKLEGRHSTRHKLIDRVHSHHDLSNRFTVLAPAVIVKVRPS